MPSSSLPVMRATGAPSERPVASPTRGGEPFRDDHRAAVDLVGAVVELRMKRDRQVRRDRPGGRRPDQDRDLTPGQRRHRRGERAGAFGCQQELDVDRGRRVVVVLDFGLGERRAAVDAPVHRLLALVNQPLLDETAKRSRDRRLIGEVHRQVEVIPVAEDAEPLELRRHHVDEARRVRAAGTAELGDREVALLGAELAIDLELDRKPVAVVAEDVGRVEAHHRPALDDEILQDLVHRRADVDTAVGVGRTVVQDELRTSLAPGADLPVEIHLLPAGEGLRLSRLQVRLHREVGPREVQCVFPVRHVCISSL